MQGYGEGLVKQSVNLMEGAMAAIDLERDPRCLLLGFQSIRELSHLYMKHDPEVTLNVVLHCKKSDSSINLGCKISIQHHSSNHPSQQPDLHFTVLSKKYAGQSGSNLPALPSHHWLTCAMVWCVLLKHVSWCPGSGEQGRGPYGSPRMLLPNRVHAAAKHGGQRDACGAGSGCRADAGFCACFGSPSHPPAAGKVVFLPQVSATAEPTAKSINNPGTQYRIRSAEGPAVDAEGIVVHAHGSCT